MYTSRRVVAAVVISALLPIGAQALTYDVMIRAADVTFQPASFFVNDRVRVYATVRNIGDSDVQGNAFFSENGTAIGTPPPFSVKAKGAEEEVWVDWQPATTGDRQIFVRVITAPETRDEDVTNNEMIIPVTVRERAPPPPSVPLPFPAASSSSGGTASGGTASTTSAPGTAVAPVTTKGTATTTGAAATKSAERSAPHSAPRPAPAVAQPASPKVSTTPAATNAPTSAPAAVNAPAPESAASRALTAKESYDAQLRQLLGTRASPWRSAAPIVAGVVALVALVALAAILMRRRACHNNDHGSTIPPVDRRSRRRP